MRFNHNGIERNGSNLRLRNRLGERLRLFAAAINMSFSCSNSKQQCSPMSSGLLNSSMVAGNR